MAPPLPTAELGVFSKDTKPKVQHEAREGCHVKGTLQQLKECHSSFQASCRAAIFSSVTSVNWTLVDLKQAIEEGHAEGSGGLRGGVEGARLPGKPCSSLPWLPIARGGGGGSC